MQSMYFSKGADCVDKREGLCDVQPCNVQFAFSPQKGAKSIVYTCR